jgi:hypothetical protein
LGVLLMLDTLVDLLYCEERPEFAFWSRRVIKVCYEVTQLLFLCENF